MIGKALRKYGWPAEFREDDWAQDSGQIYEAAAEIEYPYLEPTVPSQGIDADEAERDELVAFWRENPDLVPDIGPDVEE